MSTHLAADLQTGDEVVVKTLPSQDVPAATQLRLEHEADALRDLGSGDVASPLALGRDGDVFYVVRPYVHGTTLQQRFETGPVTTRETLEIARGLMSAMQLGHERGVLHRAVKPGNVIVRDGRVTLVDFGFVPTTRVRADVTGVATDAVRYVSPEQAGLLRRDVDERSDLYSAGALLFECLAGRSPFTGASVSDVLRQHLTQRPPSLRSFDAAIPTALDDLVARMLRKDPRDRYQSADAVRDDLRDLEDALARGIDDPELVLGLHERRRRAITEPAFVARGAELARLEEEVERSTHARPGLALLEAPSGGGKTRLLDELERSIAQRDVWVLRGQGRDQGAQRPFQLLDGIVRGVVARCATDERFASRLRERLAGREDALLEAMPDLAPALGGAHPRAAVTQRTEQHGETRTIRALADLIDALGTVERPAVVMLDDCQWADEQTTKLLAHWRRADDRGQDRRAHALVVVAFRSDELAPEHPLRALRASSRVVLDPLTAEAVRDLVESMAGAIPASASELVVRLAEGNAFVAVEILRGLVEAGALAPGDGGWRVVDELLADVHASSRSAADFSRRLHRVPDELLDLLAVGAVLGKQFSVTLAAELAGRSPREALSLLADARRRHIVWSDPDGERCAFVHDKLREALLDRLAPERRAAMHRGAALHLQQQEVDGEFELAYHFDAAGEHAQALPYALRAAASARLRYALDVAQHQYEIALRGARGQALRREIAEGLGDVAMLRGRYDDAAAHFAAARELCDSDVLAAGIDGRLGELAFKRGDVESAAQLLERALRLLHQRVPRRRTGFLLALLWQVVVQFAHSVAPALFVGRRKRAPTARERLTMRLHSELAHAYWFGSGLVPCGWTHLRGMNLAERHSPTAELAQAYSEHAPVTTMLPWTRRGIAYAERSLAIRRSLGDRWGEGQSLGFYSAVLYTAGRFEDALEKASAAVDILERTGDQWEINVAGWHIALALYRLGRMNDAAAAAQRVHRAAIEVGDKQSSGIAVGAWAKATGGMVPPEVVDAELQHAGGDVHARAEVLQAKSLRLIAEGRLDDAVAVLADADLHTRRSGLRQEYVAPVRPWLVTALRMQLEQTSPLAAGERRRRTRRARRASRRAHRQARSYRNNLLHALRERALVEAIAGHPRRARRMLARSLTIAVQQGAQGEAALTRAARAGLRAALDDDPLGEAARAGREPPAWAAGRPVVARVPPPDVTLSLADRYATVLDAGRAIASALTDEAVFAAVVSAAETLLRGESCAVVALDVGAERDAGVLAGAADAEPTRVLIERTLHRGATVVLSEEDLQREAGHRVGSGRVRSALCAPIFVRGRATACLYVTHSEVGALFGDEEERMAAFIAALAGAALENAEGFAEVQALSATLEERVARRTAELRASMERVEIAVSLLSATLDATADGLLVVDLEGRIVNHNKRFAEMWRIPQHVLAAREDDRAISFVLEQLSQPDLFLSTTSEAYSQPDIETRDELEFLDGRVFERRSKPHRLGDEAVGRVWSFRDITDQKRFESQLKHLADHDGLTDLLNRRRFEEDLAREAGIVARYGGSLAALLLDVDNFKFVNDTLGHKAGDELIRSVAGLLRGRLRDTDILARLGGDEFAVLLPGSTPEHAQLVAADLLELIRRHTAFIGGERVSMTASIGVALLGESDGDGSQLMVDADLAMYEAKAAGRDGLSFSTPERAQQARLEGRYRWGERIRDALEHDGFVLHAQPILDLASGALSQYELLLRMRADDGALIPPNAFLPTAERLNLVQAIDRWVVNEAIAVIAEHARAGDDLHLEVNLSGRSMGDLELTELIERELAATGINPGNLIFEVTETTAIANMDSAQEFARKLSELGCQFVLDDFGTGFGSFYYLKYLPVSYLKIDGEFIAGMADNETDQLMVKAIVQIAHGLGKRTIAEFVGDGRTQALLAQYGVDLAQGYHIGLPIDVARLAQARRAGDMPAA
ncbi:MAG: EAL domain-containing protein [Thermoleophilia bacterium]